ncbi:MAG: SBBP repeat-containing protein [Candidatus Binataceae bacterium]
MSLRMKPRFTGLVVAVMVAVACSMLATTPSNIRSSADRAEGKVPAAKQRAGNILAGLPLSFEPNLGQTDSRVKFLSHGKGYTLFLTGEETVLSLSKPAKLTAVDKKHKGLHASAPGRSEGQVLRVELVGGNPHAQIDGLDQLSGKVNYFIGNDPKKWRTNILTYARVRYRSVYPGVDLVYYGTGQRELEYDFVVASGADPGAIAIKFDGAKELALGANGDLHVKLASDGEVIHRAPVAYQERDGHRQPVSGRWILEGQRTARFALAAYDRSHSLYIDPGLVYSTYLGGSGTVFGSGDTGYAIAVDSTGAAYATGMASSADFPTTAGAYQRANNGFANAFVTKLNPAGTALVYSTYLGGSDDDYGVSIAVDSSLSAYVTGFAWSSNFPTTSGAFQTINNANGTAPNAFVTKLKSDGTALIYSTYLGGSLGDNGYGIVVDSGGYAYVTGDSYSPDFPITGGAFQTTNNGAVTNGVDNAFVTKLATDGKTLVYSTFLGGSGDSSGTSGDYASGIAVDSGGFAYVTGDTYSGDFPTTPGAFQSANNAFGSDADNAFVAKLNAAGTQLIYSTYLGGSNGDYATAIALDSATSAYVTGDSYSSDFPITAGVFQINNNAFANSADNAFVTKLNTTGTALVYSTYLGGSGTVGGGDYGSGIALDNTGAVYITGDSYSANFPTTAGAFQTINKAAGNTADNAFATKLNPAGTALINSTYLGGSGTFVPQVPAYFGDNGSSIGLDSAKNAYVIGTAISTDFPTTPGAFQTTNNGAANTATNAFVTKLSTVPTNPPLVWQDTTTGDRAVWYVNGINLVSGFVFATIAPEWQIAAVADINGDGQPDLIWQDTTTGDRAVWYMNNFTITSAEVFANVAPEWQIVGVGDFNGDGHPDLIWQDTTTGDRAVWYMDGSFNLKGSAVFTNIPPQWQIVGVGDFNGDGQPDLIWQDTATGDRAVWFMNGINLISGVVFTNIPTQWQIVGVGDYNGDGHPDLLWQDTATGDRAVWFMNGINLISGEVFTNISTEWQLVQ